MVFGATVFSSIRMNPRKNARSMRRVRLIFLWLSGFVELMELIIIQSGLGSLEPIVFEIQPQQFWSILWFFAENESNTFSKNRSYLRNGNSWGVRVGVRWVLVFVFPTSTYSHLPTLIHTYTQEHPHTFTSSSFSEDFIDQFSIVIKIIITQIK